MFSNTSVPARKVFHRGKDYIAMVGKRNPTMFPNMIFVIFAPCTRLFGKFLLHKKIKYQPGRHLGGQVESHNVQHLCQHRLVHMPDTFRNFGVLWLVFKVLDMSQIMKMSIYRYLHNLTICSFSIFLELIYWA